jgi:hypothetical protein
MIPHRQKILLILDMGAGASSQFAPLGASTGRPAPTGGTGTPPPLPGEGVAKAPIPAPDSGATDSRPTDNGSEENARLSAIILNARREDLFRGADFSRFLDDILARCEDTCAEIAATDKEPDVDQVNAGIYSSMLNKFREDLVNATVLPQDQATVTASDIAALKATAATNPVQQG